MLTAVCLPGIKEEGPSLAYSLPDPSDLSHGWHVMTLVEQMMNLKTRGRICFLWLLLINYHKLGGFKPNTFILSQFWSPEV